MGRKKKQNETNSNTELNDSTADIIEDSSENTESNQDVMIKTARTQHAKIPQIEKGIPHGKITFDIFFAYCIKAFPAQIKVDHYRAMKNYLKQKNNAMIDTKDGFCESFKSYGLIIE